MAENEIAHDTPNPLKAKHHRRNRLLGVGVVVFFLFLSFLALQVILQYFARPVLRSFLQDLVEKKTNGLYSVDFDSLSLNTAKRTIFIKNFRLEPNIDIYHQMKERGTLKKAVYRVHFAELTIDHLSNLNLYIRRKLEVENISIIKPRIWLIGFPRQKEAIERKRYDAVNKDIIPLFEKYLKSVDVKQITIRNGYFSLNLDEQANQQFTVANDINISLHQFHLDSKSGTNALKNMFYSQDIEISVKQYELMLGDSIHTLRLGEVKLSTLKNEIVARDLELSPDQLAIGKLRNRKKNLLLVKVPHIKLTHFDVRNALMDRDIRIAEFSIANPAITIVKKDAGQKSDTAGRLSLDSRLDLYQMIKGNLRSIQLDTFTLKQAQMKIFRRFGDNIPIYRVENVGITLYDFLVDSVALLNRKKVFFAENIELEIRNFRMEMADNLHHLFARRLNISTLDSRIEAKDIMMSRKVDPAKSMAAKGKMTYNIKVPNLLLTGVDLVQAYNYHKLNVKSVVFTKPGAEMVKVGEQVAGKTSKPKRVDYVYEMISPYLNSLVINEFRIDNGNYSLRNQPDSLSESWSEGKINFGLSHFRVDRSTIYKSDRLFNADKIDLNFEDYLMKLKNNFHVLNIKKIRVSSIDSIFLLESVNLKAEPYDDELALLKKYRQKSIIDFSMDKFLLEKVDIPGIWFQKHFVFQSGAMVSPIIKLLQYPELNFPVPFKDTVIQSDTLQLAARDSVIVKDTVNKFLAFFKKNLNTANFSKFEIQNGNLIWSKSDTLGNGQIVFDNEFAAKIDSFRFDVDSIEKDFRHFFSKDISFKLNNYSSLLAQDKYRLTANEIGFSTLGKNMYISGLYLKPDYDFAAPGIFNLDFPRVNISQIDFYKILNNKELVADSIWLGNGTFRMITNPALRQALKLEPKTVDTLPKAKFPLKSIEIKNIAVNNQFFNLLRDQGGAVNSLLNFKISANLSGLNADTLFFGKQKKLPNYDNLLAHITRLAAPFADSIHVVKVDEIDINAKDSALLVKNAGVGYANLAEGQLVDKLITAGKDKLWNIRSPKLQFSGVDIPKAFIDRRFNARFLDIQNPVAKVENYTIFQKAREKEQNWFEVIGKVLDELKIDKAKFSGASITLNKHFVDSTTSATFANIDGMAINFALDTVIAYDSTRFYYSDDISARLKNHVFRMKDSIYTISAKNIYLSSGKKTVEVDSMVYSPIWKKEDYQDHFTFQKPMFYAYIPHGIFYRFDIPKLLKARTLSSEYGVVDGLNFEVFSDRRVEPAFTPRGKQLSDLLDDVSMPLRFDTIRLRNSRMAFDEITFGSPAPGSLFLDSIYGQITNISNMPEIRQKMLPTNISANYRLMGTGQMTTFVRTVLNDTNRFAKITGTMGTMDLRNFNPYLENAFFMSINSGKLANARFQLEVNNKFATGNIRAKYNNLNVSILQMTEGKRDAKGLYSFFANTLIRQNNPKNRFSLLKEGKIYLDRDSSKMVFSYWMSAVFVGLKSTLGFESKEVKKAVKRDARLLKILKRQRNKKKGNDLQAIYLNSETKNLMPVKISH
jgi:hypothetical protein